MLAPNKEMGIRDDPVAFVERACSQKDDLVFEKGMRSPQQCGAFRIWTSRSSSFLGLLIALWHLLFVARDALGLSSRGDINIACFNHDVDRKGRPGKLLAVAAVAAIHKYWGGFHGVGDHAAITTPG